ncbi:MULTISPECIES: phage tail terminator family protein [Psychrilyobacter]|uniref:Uncharacterized protein n=1 Tax=Psychrilyobacter piezotolerans TaxID=2293438 RepID=A0ABX9KIR1_9FUSO|nr:MULTISPECIES: hypothetical protein [Psychrilyobacter]MCS5420768.1 hypothetical protein [Psychrilyobacter sp. S5]NDI77438.1 hypothetical protein [Psychrilyobacter piezotolerans]RDE63741.1 hypothetical protein DV867_05025 [Psychrilyobacter sp. S5]REI42085.1 hypothetical protein DYH56_05025 [Psychrilyobacter piezotolerans]
MSYIKILNAVNKKLKTKFDLPILSSGDVEEKIIRPSFMVELDNMGSSDFMSVSQDKEMSVRIHYFSSKKDKNKIENLNMIDSLDELFVEDSILKVEEGFNLDIDSDIDIDIVDKVLQYSFDIEFSQLYNKVDNVEMMGELNIKGVD